MQRLWSLVLVLGVAHQLTAQTQQATEKKQKKKHEIATQVDLVPHEAARIFTVEEPITFTLTADFDRLRHDKRESPWRGATITIADSTGTNVDIPIKVKTRGIWRLHQCDFPPLRLDFVKHTVKHTLFAQLDKPKLVSHCRDNDEYEQWVLQEMQLYRVYNLLTPYSHRVRLARVAYVDSAKTKPVATRYAFLEEEPEALASRVGGMILKQQGAGPGDLDRERAVIFFLFQYLIGNTDFSVAGLHNVELVTRDTDDVPIAYDFDFSGAVNARYATTAPSLPIKRVRERLYRGYCALPAELYPAAFALFKSKKDSIYALYRDPIGRLLEGNRAKETLEYFDDFFSTIEHPNDANREIIDRCVKGGV